MDFKIVGLIVSSLLGVHRVQQDGKRELLIGSHPPRVDDAAATARSLIPGPTLFPDLGSLAKDEAVKKQQERGMSAHTRR